MHSNMGNAGRSVFLLALALGTPKISLSDVITISEPTIGMMLGVVVTPGTLGLFDSANGHTFTSDIAVFEALLNGSGVQINTKVTFCSAADSNEIAELGDRFIPGCSDTSSTGGNILDEEAAVNGVEKTLYKPDPGSGAAGAPRLGASAITYAFISDVPEPSSPLLLGTVVGLLAVVARRRRSKRAV